MQCMSTSAVRNSDRADGKKHSSLYNDRGLDSCVCGRRMGVWWMVGNTVMVASAGDGCECVDGRECGGW